MPRIGAGFMKRGFAFCLSMVVLASSVAGHAADGVKPGKSKPDVIAFNANVRVDVDANGKPVKVEAPADLPQAIRGYIEKRVASWQYQPAMQNNVAVPATTYVSVGACALPDETGDNYRLGVDFKGNGPGLVSATGRLEPPVYPRDAMMRGSTGAFRVVYSISGEGKPKVDEIVPMDDVSKRSYKAFHAALEKWASSLPYRPETVNGQPVTTQISTLVEFRLDDDIGTPQWRQRYIEELKSRAIASSECALASGRGFGLVPIAMDSPVKITPAPAG
ncbi:MAG: energy transducer TonB [Thermomonas sp.]|uniref:energy transducer TonB n=1 Tax=Thermomonas sp. TaxID=1971895 RepID=UPI0039E39B3F